MLSNENMLEDEEQQSMNQPVQVAELPPMTKQEQAESTLTANEAPREIEDEGSKIDLTNPTTKQQMDEDYNQWWNLPREDPNRELLKNAFYEKYYGGEEPVNKGGFYPGSNSFANFEGTLQGLSAGGLAIGDFFMDVAGHLPGMAAVDNSWDRSTRLDNPIHQNVRRVLSVVLPSMYGTGVVTKGLMSSQLPRTQKLIAGAAAYAGVDMAVVGLSDTGEEENILGIMSEAFPGVFGDKGTIPLPSWLKTLDSDSPAVRRQKNMWENGLLSVMGTTIGAFITLRSGKKTMEWFEPKDELAAVYKRQEISKLADPEKLIEIQKLNTLLASKQVSRGLENDLINEIENLKASLDETVDLEDALRKLDIAKEAETNEAARRAIRDDPNSTEFNPDVTPILEDSSNARQSVPPGNVARNMADTTAIKKGVSEGDPAPIITESMRTKGLLVGSTSRDAVLGVAEEARDLGRFNALVDGFRFTREQMNAAAWDIYTSIIDPGASLDDVKSLFIRDKDTANMLMGKFKVEYINEEQARAAAFAMRDLTDRYLGRNIAMNSARVMDTLGREATTISQAIQELQPFTDDPRAMDLIIDKLQFLMDEYALNKYISGWRLRNKNWFDQAPPRELDQVIDTLTKEFKTAENAIHNKNLRFTETLKELADTNPLAMRPLVDAYAHSNGDVDTLAKLMTWAADQVTPTGLLKSPDPKELNLFARGTWSVVMNNVLSGLSPLRAVVGNGGLLSIRPIIHILGHGIWGPVDAFEGLKRTFYYHGAMMQTNQRAVKDAYRMMKKAHKDPELMIKAYRKDFTGGALNDPRWQILEDMRPVWEQSEDYGRILQYDAAKTLRDLGTHPALRYGMTAMVFPDVFTWTHIATYLSRMRAYDDVFSEFGFADWTKIIDAEKKHYKTMFDENGLIKDDVLRAISGEISLNLDDGLATWINQGTTAYPIAKHLMMFPRTQSNVVKNALSWTPVSLIPGINKYSKTIYAQTDDDIAKALAEHGIDYATTPNGRILFENLRAEYTGRVAFSSLLTGSLWGYAMAGNIRGNGHYNASRRQKEWNQFGYEPKTINIAGKWVSYKGIMGVDQVLSILGDLAYYASDIDQTLMEDWHAKLMWTISAGFLNETPLQGIEPLIAALNGELTAWSRLVANTARSYIPMSGALGVLSNAITSTQKDLQGEIHEYLMNRIPIASSFLPDQIDIWTGEPLNDIDHPFLRMLNALSPIKISGTREPWRVWLMETGWDGMGKLRTHSSGYEYTPEQRERIYKYIGEQQLYKKLQKLMKSKKGNEAIGKLRTHRATGADDLYEDLRLKTQYLPINQEIDRIVREAQKIAEARLEAEDKDIVLNAIGQEAIDQRMKQGDVEGARQIQKETFETQQLLQMSK